jgi:diguanylate cyclase (GGDEF)-like protein/PAS domain S-box-containing protein
MALIPIKNRDEIIGLIHLDDHREGCFNSLIIDQMEKIASHLGEAIVRKQIEEALRISEEQFRTITEQSPIAIEYYSANGYLESANPACLEMFGITEKDEIDRFSLFDNPNISDEHKAELRQGKSVRYEAPFDFDMVKKLNLYDTSKSGQVWLDILITPIMNGGDLPNGYLLQIQDISERKRLEEEKNELTLHDELTGLGNRRYLNQELEKLTLDGRRYPISFISIDINDFKMINDSDGHTAGDKALQTVASSLKDSVRVFDYVVRMGGDEFLVVLPETDKETAYSIANRINSKLVEDNTSGRPLVLSNGISTADEEKDDLEKCIDIADKIMYENKKLLKEQ